MPKKSHAKKQKREDIMFANELAKGPSALVLSIYEFEERHKRLAVESRVGGYLKIFENFYHSFTEALGSLQNIKRKKTWSDQHTIQAMFISKMPKTFFTAFVQATTGYYEQSLATQRIAYEALLSVLFIQKYPNDMWSVFGRLKNGHRNFEPSRVLADIYKVIPSVKNPDHLYRVMSSSSHGLINIMSQEISVARKSGGLRLDLDFYFDLKRMSMALNVLIVLLYFYIRVFIKIFDPYVVDLRLPHYRPLIKFIEGMPPKLAEQLKTIGNVLHQL